VWKTQSTIGAERRNLILPGEVREGFLGEVTAICISKAEGALTGQKYTVCWMRRRAGAKYSTFMFIDTGTDTFRIWRPNLNFQS